ncbi:glycoside hydrolase family 47 protein [Mixia osmundae IAM 14324]|uniref:alpha-1,2-Mannosidase n=1 Tax=Mixia osmundae (strain CBS 9802 / IAM 14324 / JCM 22182 / KY 12970) TaxID=764103 RepID=G7E1H0_MIXOS|nr:glycoside hydrolase family 47 protein [Mixia osmundae IAM 14324]KEI36634.1 glycoside hydrolase family 47 protein [Mixia osmundae IAM 14324]GAA96680.1 hypothetical protein E5Q_03351 [Mixia osmundae IAM 14324]
MRWRTSYWSVIACVWLCVSAGGRARAGPAMSNERKRQLRELTRETFNHGMRHYMRVAYPQAELRPLSCQPLGPSPDPTDEINDVVGHFPLTLIDALDTFVVFQDKAGFERAVKDVLRQLSSFDMDSKVQVFEVTIRVMGGLLSAHIFASDETRGFAISGYKGELLSLAQDLGERLLPAFQYSLTGMPFARINLRHGISRTESTETCTAGAGSLLLEFATLSRLTDNPIYEQVARKAFFSLWAKRSALNLLGNTIDLQTGAWIYGIASVGAGIDSFMEYMIKAYVLLGDEEYWNVFAESYDAIQQHVKSSEGHWYRGVNMHSGKIAQTHIDSLGAFWPGTQVLAGDVESAIKGHLVYANIWARYSGLPETFSIQNREAVSAGYPLRPEFIESTLYLYRATGDPYYLFVGERFIEDFVNRTRVDCGLASLKNVKTGGHDDRMHSFVLSETLKYAYLLFDESNPVHKDESNAVWSTEGHYLAVDRHKLNHSTHPLVSTSPQRGALRATCVNPVQPTPWTTSIAARGDADVARALVNWDVSESFALQTGMWSPYSQCAKPELEQYVRPSTVEVVFSPNGQVEDPNPGADKVIMLSNGFVVRKMEGLRLTLTQRPDSGGAYDITRISQYMIPKGATVFFADPSVLDAFRHDPQSTQEVRLKTRYLDTAGRHAVESHLGMRATFGPNPLLPNVLSQTHFARNAPMRSLIKPSSTTYGCHPYSVARPANPKASGPVVFLLRGHCTFVDKAYYAAQSGASGLIVSSDHDEALQASGDGEPVDLLAKLSVPLITVSNSTGTRLDELLSVSNRSIQIEAMPPELVPDSKIQINNCLLLNVKLLE